MNAHAGYIEVCNEIWEKDWSPQNQGPEVEGYTLTYQCYTTWEDDYWSSNPINEPEPEPIQNPELPAYGCEQAKVDVLLRKQSCRAEALEWGADKSQSCDAGLSAAVTIQIAISKMLGFEVTPSYSDSEYVPSAINYRVQRLVSDCDSRAEIDLTLIGSCDQYK